jgi:hypothetical protein
MPDRRLNGRTLKEVRPKHVLLAVDRAIEVAEPAAVWPSYARCKHSKGSQFHRALP